MRFFIPFAFVCIAPTVCLAGNDEPLAVVVAQAQTTRLNGLPELAQIYRRKRLSWEGGSRIHPVNLPPDAPLRRVFSLSVLGSAPEALTQY